MKNLLFICSENRLRCPTAEAVFSDHSSFHAIRTGTNNDFENTVTGDLIERADVILVMENSHRAKISKKFQQLLKNKKLAVLDIPDNYAYMGDELATTLKARVAK